jgi:hypothetical protein
MKCGSEMSVFHDFDTQRNFEMVLTGRKDRITAMSSEGMIPVDGAEEMDSSWLIIVGGGGRGGGISSIGFGTVMMRRARVFSWRVLRERG